MAKKKYDLAVKVGEKADKKAIWKNIGAVLEKEDGAQFILLDRTFNPAGVPDDGRGSILINRFPVKSDQPDSGGGDFPPSGEIPF